MTRIFIIGGPGSGKTTLAKRIAAQFNIPCYEMDVIGWENGAGAARPLEVRLREVHEIAQQTNWVAEGWFRPWTNELLHRADQVVWLDPPWPVARWRIVTRHLRTSLSGNNRHRGLLKLYRFLVYTKRYYAGTLPHEDGSTINTKELLPYMDKTTRCQHPAEVEKFFTQLLAQQSNVLNEI